MWDTFSSYFGPKKIDRVGRGGQKSSKYGLEWASLINPMQNFWLQSPLDVPKGVMDPENELKAIRAGGTIWGPFQGSLTH